VHHTTRDTAGDILHSAGAGRSAYALLHEPTDDGPSKKGTTMKTLITALALAALIAATQYPALAQWAG
jgi:hypothetical protein